jgi:hypothetical protein
MQDIPKDILLQLIPLLPQNNVFVTVDNKTNIITITASGIMYELNLSGKTIWSCYFGMQSQLGDQLSNILSHQQGRIMLSHNTNMFLCYDNGYRIENILSVMCKVKITIPEIYTPLIDQTLAKLLP